MMMMMMMMMNSMGLGDALVEQIACRDGCKLKCAKLTCQISWVQEISLIHAEQHNCFRKETHDPQCDHMLLIAQYRVLDHDIRA
jgi:hypothetical protein